jgi:predicted XRE-type DNA-binding protein
MAARKASPMKKRVSKREAVTKSSGNVFADLGFPAQEATHMLLRSSLIVAVRLELKDRNLTQAKAAKILGVTQPRVSDLVRGRIELFSIDTLVEFLARLGISVGFRTTRVASPHAA